MKTNNLTFIFAFASLLFAGLACGESVKTTEWQKAQIIAEKVDHPQAITADNKFIMLPAEQLRV